MCSCVLPTVDIKMSVVVVAVLVYFLGLFVMYTFLHLLHIK